MRACRFLLVTLLAVSGIAVSTVAFGGVVVWLTAADENPYFKQYPSVTTPSQAISTLVAGPGMEEVSEGLVSAIPLGTTLKYVQFSVDGAVINLSKEAAAGLSETSAETIFRQFMYTLTQFGLDANVRVLIDDKPISAYLPPLPESIYSAPSGPEPSINAVGLSGKRITLSPGHGLYYTGSYWTTQRGGSCGHEPEDYNNVRFGTYLKTFLENDGAYVQPVREFNMSRTGGPSGAAWFQYSAYAWLRDAGYSCSVYASSSGVCSYTGASHSDDDIRARPLASNLDSRGNTDIYVSIHTNAFQGDCSGTSCPSGTDCYYTSDGGHESWASASITLAQKTHDGVIAGVQSAGETRADGIAWGCHGSCSAKYGNFGETRIPSRPACLIELGFHDSCTSDAPKMEEPFFQSVAMWGMYNGICQYFGNTPTWAMYSAQAVSNTIPDSMHTGQIVSVSVTMRNKGVLWQEAHGFRLGAPSGSDPFAGNRQTLGSASVNNNGTYSFTFNFTAPSTPGTYTTTWRMVRDGYAWFGDTVTKQVVVQPGTIDIDPPTVPGNLVAESTDYNKAHLSWTASTDNVSVASYEIWRNGASVATVSHPTVTYDDTTLSGGTTYTYQVRAKDTSSNYSGFSNSSVAKTWTIIAQTSFPNLTGWTAGRVADGTYRGVSLDSGVGSSMAGGSGAPSGRADIGSAGTNGSYSYLGFAAPFAVGYIECSFKDSSANDTSRQGISFRKFLNDDPTQPRLVYFLGIDSAISGGRAAYTYEVFSATALWTKTVSTFARSAGWHRFRISMDGSQVYFVVDGTQVGAPAEPVESPEGCNRFYIGHNYNVNQTGWYDDFLAVFPSPPTPTMGAPSAIGADRITWNYARGNKNWEQGFYVRDLGGALKATGARGSTSVVEAGLAANTLHTRTVSAFNGTLESNVSSQASATTLSTAPSTSNMSVTPAKQVWTKVAFTVSTTIPFGPGGVEYFRYQFDQSPAYAWAGDEPAWNGGALEVSGTETGTNWYLHLKGFNSVGVANGTLDLGPFYYDIAAPLIASVTDDGDWTASTTELHAVWSASDVGSGVAGYEYAVGTTSGGAEVRDWTSAGLVTEITAGGLALTEGPTYYISVRATDAVGNTGDPVSSDGIAVAPLAAKISDAKVLGAGAACRLLGKAVVGAFDGRVYIEELDRSSGMAVVTSATPALGDTIDIAGVLSGTSEERSISASYLKVVGSGVVIDPVFMVVSKVGGSAFGPAPGKVGGVGLNNIGLLVCVSGLTSGRNPATGEFTVTDGSGGVKVSAPGVIPPDDGVFVRVVGVARLDTGLAPFISRRLDIDIRQF